MRFLTEKISKLRINWNERPLNERDFYRLCWRFKITVAEMPLVTDGFYYRLMGRDFIAVDSKLSGQRRLAVLFHELGHFLFHTPENGATANFHGVGRRTRKEIEADVFALCALIPRREIESGVIENDLPQDLINARFGIYKRYGL